MMVVHFSEVLAGVKWPPGFLKDVMGLLDGRAAATFVVLAGVGVALRTRRALESNDAEAIGHVRSVLLKRGLFLLIAGFINLGIWPGDILRVYGITFILVAWCFRLADRTILAISGSFILGFIVLMGLVDYSKHWNWDTMEYRELWSSSGIIRNLFYDGYRSVFPWAGFLFFGIWLGRRDLRDSSTRRRLILWGAGIAFTTEIVSRILIRLLSAQPRPLDKEMITGIFGTVSMPPLPMFLLASGGTAVAVIVLCIEIAERWPHNGFVKGLAATGQLAFTWYMAHIIIGLGTIDALGLTGSKSLAVGMATGIGFFALTIPLSLLWKKKWKTGPLEGLMRRLAGG
jgi:uncharacterized membrane protein YeiB